MVQTVSSANHKPSIKPSLSFAVAVAVVVAVVLAGNDVGATGGLRI